MSEQQSPEEWPDDWPVAAITEIERREEEITRLQGEVIQGSYCPTHGWYAGVDEDGCCAGCGRDAMLYGQELVDALRATLSEREEEIERLKDVIGKKRLGQHMHGIDVCGYCVEGDEAKRQLPIMASRIAALEGAAQDALHTLRYGADGSEPEWVRGSIALLEQALFAPTPPAPVFAPGVTGRQMPPVVAPSSPG